MKTLTKTLWAAAVLATSFGVAEAGSYPVAAGSCGVNGCASGTCDVNGNCDPNGCDPNGCDPNGCPGGVCGVNGTGGVKGGTPGFCGTTACPDGRCGVNGHGHDHNGHDHGQCGPNGCVPARPARPYGVGPTARVGGSGVPSVRTAGNGFGTDPAAFGNAARPYAPRPAYRPAVNGSGYRPAPSAHPVVGRAPTAGGRW